jgi:hypothetical protein
VLQVGLGGELLLLIERGHSILAFDWRLGGANLRQGRRPSQS